MTAQAAITVLGEAFGSSWQEASVMKERRVDIVIVGSGSAGLNAMAQAREAGRSFVLINGGTAGTTCARIGSERTTAKRQGWRFVFEGAVIAAWSKRSSSSKETGRSLN